MAVLDARPQDAAGAAAPAPPQRWAGKAQRTCPECGHAFRPVQHIQLFCTRACKRAFHNLWLKRGAVGAVLDAAARATRGGTRGAAADREVGRRARRDGDHLRQIWREEDEAAGRMPALAYVALRYRYGLVDVVRPPIVRGTIEDRAR